jgi:hypothetical protein
MIGTIIDAWVSLASAGIAGLAVAILLLIFAVLLAGCIVVWTLAGIKFIGRELAVGFRRGWNR